MSKKKRWLIATLGLVFAIVLSSVYTMYAKRNITIHFGMFAGSNWDVPNGNSYEIFEDAIARFEKKYPNVKVEFVSGIQKEDYSEYMAQKALSGTTPDVFMTLGEDFSTFAASGVLENLDHWIEKDRSFSLRDYYDASLQAGEYHGSQYALPFESVPTLMFVNKTLLEKEGIEMPRNDWTWEDFYRICKQVSKDVDGDGQLDQFGVYGYDWQVAAYSNGVSVFNRDGTSANMNTQSMKTSVEFTQRLNALLSGNSVVRSQDFDEGNVVFCPMQFSQYRAYMPYPWRVKKYSNFEWDCIALPAGPNGDNVSEVSTLSMGMSAKSKNKQYAWEFLKMLTYDETTQKNIFVHSQGVSTLKKINQSEDVIKAMVQDNPGNSKFEMRILNEVMQNGECQLRFKKYDDAMSMVDNEIYRIINTVDIDLGSELNVLQHKIDVYLKE